MKLAERMNHIGVETAFEVLVRARALEAQGRDIIHLEIGEPDFDTPRHIVEAAKTALDQGWTHYGPTQGLPELRDVIAKYISGTRNIQVGPEHVSVVPGGKPIIFFPMMALLEPGDEVIYPNPGFPIYESMIEFLGAKPVPMPLIEDRGFSLDLNLFRDSLTDKTKMVILNSPQNPTGGVIPAEDIRAIADMLRDRDVMVLSDEIYSRIYFDAPPLSIASLPGMLEKTIILDGFSKTYAMTGWRMGYGVMPDLAGRSREQADGQFQLLHGELYATRRNCRSHRTARRSRSNGGGVQAPPRHVLRGSERLAGIPMPDSARGVLRFSEHHRDRSEIETIRRRAAGGNGCRRFKRNGVRSVRRRLLALQHR